MEQVVLESKNLFGSKRDYGCFLNETLSEKKCERNADFCRWMCYGVAFFVDEGTGYGGGCLDGGSRFRHALEEKIFKGKLDVN